jgi:uncharacterized protein (DUF302 family)
MIAMKSGFDFKTTVKKVDSLIKARPFVQLIAKIDYEENARQKGLFLRPTTVFIFGNPDLYSLMVTCRQTLAIDLPQRMLIWKDDTGQVWIGQEPPPKSSDRHGVNCRKVLRHMFETSHEIANKAAGRYDAYVEW